MNKIDDTIAAVATPSGKGAIAMLRVSGKDAFNAVLPYFRRKKQGNVSSASLQELLPEKRAFGLVCDGERIIDEVILSLYSSPHSYTGEDMAEVYCHNNSYIIKEIMLLLLRKARSAEPGEFTQRAFFNNKLDLTRAEAVGDLFNVSTAVSHHTAMMQLEGSLNKHINALLEELTRYRVQLEMEIDFTEQDLPEINLESLKQDLEALRDNLQNLLKTGKEGRILREGLVVCLAGEPNVGKSSIFNRLLETNRAIVTAKPGTTRDYLEEATAIDGYLVRLIDTAGLRDTEEEVESIGIGITREMVKKADKVIFIEDGCLKWEKRYEALLADETVKENISGKLEKTEMIKQLNDRVISVLNKSDTLEAERIKEYENAGFLAISAKTGEGIDRLKQLIVAELKLGTEEIDRGILTNLRQISAAEKALAALEHSLETLTESGGIEFVAFDLKQASEALEEIIGKITDDDILNRIFADFCIGK